MSSERQLEQSGGCRPGERLVVCRNPLLADKRARKREELLQATEAKLDAIVTATQRKKRLLSGSKKIGLRVGRVIDKDKMSKHFELTITDDSFSYSRREDNIAEEALPFILNWGIGGFVNCVVGEYVR